MRSPAFLLLPIALVSLAPGAASAQQSFGAVVVRPEPPPPPVLSSAPTRGVEIRRLRSGGMIAGGSVLVTLGIVGVASGAAWLHGMGSDDDCSKDRGLLRAACGFGQLGEGFGEIAALTVALLGAGALAGGIALIVVGASPARPSPELKRPRALPEVSLTPRSLALKWTF